MNAYELADEIDSIAKDWLGQEKSGKLANMLRQQADQLDKVVPQLVKANGLIENLRLRIAELEKGGCGNCHACLVGVMENGYPVTMQRMIVCSDCGNKRCPKASNHRHQCTGSNEPNQRGSIYTTPQTKPLSDKEIWEIYKSWTRWIDGKYELQVVQFAREILKKASEK